MIEGACAHTALITMDQVQYPNTENPANFHEDNSAEKRGRNLAIDKPSASLES